MIYMVNQVEWNRRARKLLAVTDNVSKIGKFIVDNINYFIHFCYGGKNVFSLTEKGLESFISSCRVKSQKLKVDCEIDLFCMSDSSFPSLQGCSLAEKESSKSKQASKP
ncbi:CLUMA_CG011231, isoform A [Clunio marinus]|uniref:CLUMA_CG011231, isoform A n=1 Tax=Clunio marinus TaxID=568069 RepID=A0A1J1ICA2_9DIPT|nr:CLUMA_CG011231, isoform A [Clunio marinus]